MAVLVCIPTNIIRGFPFLYTDPSTDEWIRKLWYIYTIEYYSALKKNEFESVLMKWEKPELIIQSEVSQKEKHQCSILMHIYIYRIYKDGDDDSICETAKETQV